MENVVVAKEKVAKNKPKKRTRTTRNFPATTFSDAGEFSKWAYEIGAGQPVKRLTLFNELGKSQTAGQAVCLLQILANTD